ncbi:hypothetical protein [Candidatus Leptofilum sp.]|uniref:hypothetical protein n=1 Tax=Candidatus Leptofilum sp. TaxID=3241576 RepID=UPI003B5B99F9
MLNLILEEYEDFHQRPWLHSFGNRGLYTAGGRSLGMSDVPFSIHRGKFLGIPATGKLMTMRDFDWYRLLEVTVTQKRPRCSKPLWSR